MRRLLTLAFIIVAGAAAAFYFFPEWTSAPAEPVYRLAKADRGPIIATVSATGAINPTTTVIVGSQLSGQVVEILADYNSEVTSGQVVARLNSDQIRARLDAARADLEQMRANRQVQEAQIERVRADTEKAHAALSDAEAQVARNEALLAETERVLQRQMELQGRGIVAQAALDTARSTRDAQAASLNSSRAQVNSAKAALIGFAADLRVAQANLAAVSAQTAQREAAVRQIEVDLRNTEIRSPVSGVVIQRNVELGQTVAASLQAPTLFLIADDLRQMEIAANIDEADVGRVRPGQRVTFTVNAYPGRSFEGRLKQVRLGSQTVQNVVIYTAIISIENPRLELLPGMTANLRVETERRDDVVRIPNAALRWRPAAEAASAQAGPGGEPAGQRSEAGAGAGGGRALADIGATVKSELKLTPDQEKDVDAALADARNAFRALQGADAAARREQGRAIRSEIEQKIAAVLDPGQKTKFDELRKRFADGRDAQGQTGRVFIVASNGRPEGITVRIGATDGGVTEVISGLRAGQEVIVGGGPRTGEAQRPTFGPRFGF